MSGVLEPQLANLEDACRLCRSIQLVSHCNSALSARKPPEPPANLPGLNWHYGIGLKVTSIPRATVKQEARDWIAVSGDD